MFKVNNPELIRQIVATFQNLVNGVTLPGAPPLTIFRNFVPYGEIHFVSYGANAFCKFNENLYVIGNAWESNAGFSFLDYDRKDIIFNLKTVPPSYYGFYPLAWNFYERNYVTPQNCMGHSGVIGNGTHLGTGESIRYNYDDDYVVINEFEAFLNTNDGNYSPTNKRQKLAHYVMPYMKFSAECCPQGGTTYTRQDVYINLINLFKLTTTFKNISDGISAPYTWALPTNYGVVSSTTTAEDRWFMTSNLGYLALMFGGKSFFTTTFAYNEVRAAYALNIFNLDIIKYWLSTTGLLVTYNANIEEINTIDIPDLIIDIGQPDTEPDGNNGDGDNRSDKIEITTPIITPVQGMNTAYAMRKQDIAQFSDYIWNSSFVDDIKLLWEKPAEAVISCVMFPFDLSYMGVGSIENIKIGNIQTDVPARRILPSFNGLYDMGEIKINKYYGNFLDYSPYTNYTLYLPYIGFKNLSANEITDKMLKVKYAIDVLTGECVAMIWADDILIDTAQGVIGVTIPLNNSNASENAKQALMSAVSLAGTLAGGVMSTAKNGAGIILDGATQGFNSLMSIEHHIQKGGIASPHSALYMPQYCYLIVERPKQSRPTDESKFKGYVSNVTKKLANVSGYTEISEIHLQNISATEPEINELQDLLKNGVIL